MRVTWNDIDSIYRNTNMLLQRSLDNNQAILNLQYAVDELNKRLKALEETHVD